MWEVERSETYLGEGELSFGCKEEEFGKIKVEIPRGEINRTLKERKTDSKENIATRVDNS